MPSERVQRKGWCPGAHRPMMTGDGLLVRVRPHAGMLSARQVVAIADGAARFGSGLVDLTARSNVQIRGVDEAGHAPLVRSLAEGSLLDRDAATEAVRNIVTSPLAGRDPEACLDVRPTVAALERCLRYEPWVQALPPKFGFVVDDGGSFDLSSIPADIRLSAVSFGNRACFLVHLAAPQDNVLVACCEPAAVIDAVMAICRSFLRLRQERPAPPRKMRDLVAAVGAAALVEGTAYRVDGAPQERSRPARFIREDDCLGYHALGDDGFMGVTMPFGRWSADAFRRLATIAHDFGDGHIRLTPWRTVLIPGLSMTGSAAAVAALAGSDAILTPMDPRTAVVACPGFPFCTGTTLATQNDALALVPLVRAILPHGVGLHVSGCAKGCMRRQTTRVTLVGDAGRYSLILDGTTESAAVAHHLTFDAVQHALRALAAHSFPEGAKP